MRFRYIGPDDEAPKVTTSLGYTFELRGKPVDVTDSEAIEEFRHNASFEMMGDETAYDDGVIVEAERDILKANLHAAIEAKGGTYDGRWGIERLERALREFDG